MIDGWITTPRLVQTWELSVRPTFYFSDTPWDVVLKRVGITVATNGVMVILVIVVTLVVVRHAYQARNYNSGVPSAASLLALLLHPLAGLFMLIGTGALSASFDREGKCVD